MKIEKFDKIMMETAELWAKYSYCKRLKVGAVLAKDNRILATGINGTISGKPNICEEYEKIPLLYKKLPELPKNTILCPECNGTGKKVLEFDGIFKNTDECYTCNGFGKLIYNDKTSDFTLHAEQNIISFCAKNGIPTKDTTLYITHSPCPHCAKLIVQSGIIRVVYKNIYRDDRGIHFLENCGIKVQQIKEGND